MIRFDNKTIFGQIALRQNGPVATTRNLRENLPGVTGYRIYRLGGSRPDTKIFTVTGQILALSIAQLEDVLEVGLSYMDGKVYTFVTGGNRAYRNCELTDYRQASPIRRVIWTNNATYYTCEVTGTITQASP